MLWDLLIRPFLLPVYTACFNGMVVEFEQVPKAFSGCWQDRFQEFQRTLFADQLYRETIHYNSEAKECHIQNDKLCCKGNDRFSSVGFHNRYDGTEKTIDGCKVHDAVMIFRHTH